MEWKLRDDITSGLKSQKCIKTVTKRFDRATKEG